MRAVNTVELGAVAMHKKVIGDIAAAALADIPGVYLSQFDFLGSLCDLFGFKNYPGVSVRLDKEGGVFLELRVIIEFGLNIPTTAARIQDVVRAAIERSVDIDLIEINVNIQSVQRRVALCG